MNKALTGGVIVAVVLSGLAFFTQPDQVTKTIERVVEKQVGAQVSPEHLETQYFDGGFTKGGYVATSSTGNTVLTASEIDADVNFLSFTANVNQTVTLPASTTAPFRNLAVGEGFSVLVYSATTTAGATMTWTAGTGIDLQEDEGETVVQNGLEVGRLHFVKKADTDIIAWYEAGQVGD